MGAREIPKDIIVEIDGERFEFFRARRGGVAIYASPGRLKYLRLGDPVLVAKELSFHKKLLARGFPVAPILSGGTIDSADYWIEASLGQEHFGTIFSKDVRDFGKISNASFQAFLEIVVKVHDAQERLIHDCPYDFALLAKSVGFDGMLQELPQETGKLQAAWVKTERALKDHPQSVTHGDFTPHNILPGGVIDFGDHFEGPVGFDMVNVLTTSFWFPKSGTEYVRESAFTNEQVERFFAAVGTFKTPHGVMRLEDVFDVLFFLKSTWWAVRNDSAPKLQIWRYARYLEVVERYLAGDSLLEYWRAHRDD